jgi:hypothetical protein
MSKLYNAFFLFLLQIRRITVPVAAIYMNRPAFTGDSQGHIFKRTDWKNESTLCVFYATSPHSLTSVSRPEPMSSIFTHTRPLVGHKDRSLLSFDPSYLIQRKKQGS